MSQHVEANSKFPAVRPGRRGFLALAGALLFGRRGSARSQQPVASPSGVAGFTLVHANTTATYPATLSGWLSASAAAQAGDTILIPPGNYPFALGVGKAVTVQCNPVPDLRALDPSRYATFQRLSDGGSVTNGTVTFRGLRAYGAKVYGSPPSDPNNVGFYLGSGQSLNNHINLDRCWIEECGTGVFCTGRWCVTISSTVIRNCGSNSEPNCHSIYFSQSTVAPIPNPPTLTVIGCLFDWTYSWYDIPAALQTQVGNQPANHGHWRIGIAHFIKSNAAHTLIYASKIITGGTNLHPYSCTTAKIQGDKGGVWDIRGNIIQEQVYSAYDCTDNSNDKAVQPDGPYAAVAPGQPGAPPPNVVTNGRIMDYAVFGVAWGTQSITIAQNTFINQGWQTEKDATNTHCGPRFMSLGSKDLTRSQSNRDSAAVP